MKTNITRRSFIAGAAGTCAALSVAGLADCGSGTEEGSAGTSGKTYRIGTYALDVDYYPAIYTDDDDELVGIDIDLLAAAMAIAGLDYELCPLGWDKALIELEIGKVDGIILDGLAINEENEEYYDFSDPYFTTYAFAAAADDGDIASLEDARGMYVAVKTGTLSAGWAESIANEYDFSLAYHDSDETLLSAVILGDAALCFMDGGHMAFRILQHWAPFTIVATEEEYAIQYGFAVLKGENTELLEGFNTGLAELQASGEYDEICNSYLA